MTVVKAVKSWAFLREVMKEGLSRELRLRIARMMRSSYSGEEKWEIRSEHSPDVTNDSSKGKWRYEQAWVKILSFGLRDRGSVSQV
jgi:hypothetical protein